MAEVSQFPSSPESGDQLQGWVEISAYLGRGVRTAQRWERLRGLPIRRTGIPGAELIVASRREIDAWKAEHRIQGPSRRRPRATKAAETAGPSVPPGPRFPFAFAWRAAVRGVAAARAWSHPWMWIGSLATLTALLIMWPTLRGPSPSDSAPFAAALLPKPDHWRIDRRELRVFDAADTPLWSHRFEFPLDQAAYRDGLPADSSAHLAAFDDLDRDGRPELFMIPWASSPQDRRLYVFRPNGEVAFVAPPVKSVWFGGAEFAPPFFAERFAVTRDAQGSPSIWVAASHSLRFPTVIQKLDVLGRVKGEYWSNGPVSLLASAQVSGRRVLLAGGGNPEQEGASLTILDYDHPDGSAPATTPKYRCSSCSPGSPLALLVFPTSDVARELTRQPRVESIDVASGGDLTASVLQVHVVFPGHEDPTHATVVYTLAADLRTAKAEVTDGFRQAHSELHLRGYLNHKFGPSDVAALLPIQVWQGQGFAPLSTLPVLK